MKSVDARGLACPIPVIRAKKALSEDTKIEITVDGPTAVENLTTMAERMGYKANVVRNGDDAMVSIDKGVSVPQRTEPEVIATKIKDVEEGTQATVAPSFQGTVQVPQSQGYIVVIDKDMMGAGDEELGKILLKSFIFSLRQQAVLPEYMLFYNGGVKVLLEESDSLEDLEAIQNQGVQLYACGTCVNYYGLKDSLKLAKITNMLDITEIMRKAERIVKP